MTKVACTTKGCAWQQPFLTGTKLWLSPRTRRYGHIIKEFLVGKGDFGCFLSFGEFRGIFGKF